MKAKELLEILQRMEPDATVTVRVNVHRWRNGEPATHKVDDVRVDHAVQIGAGTSAVVRLDPEDELGLYPQGIEGGYR